MILVKEHSEETSLRTLFQLLKKQKQISSYCLLEFRKIKIRGGDIFDRVRKLEKPKY